MVTYNNQNIILRFWVGACVVVKYINICTFINHVQNTLNTIFFGIFALGKFAWKRIALMLKLFKNEKLQSILLDF